MEEITEKSGLDPAFVEGGYPPLGGLLQRVVHEFCSGGVSALERTANLTNITASVLRSDPAVLSMMRMATATAQEQRQLAAIKEWLEQKGYSHIGTGRGLKFDEIEPGTFSFRLNISVEREGGIAQTNIPVDALVMPLRSRSGNLPLLIEAKSAGDYTNPNKRRKEEATKVAQLTAVCIRVDPCGSLQA